MIVRPAAAEDNAAIWSILEPMVRAGETYTIPSNWSEAHTLSYWCAAAHEVFVAEQENEIAGSYYLQANQLGGGDHVANCGYATAADWQGKGVGRVMCIHSLERAKSRGFLAMQFNFVVSSNRHAVLLWQSCGFEIVGRLPGAFRHPKLGFVDAFTMFRIL